MRGSWGAYLDRHNALIDFTAKVCRACHAVRIPWLVENPSTRSKGVAFWPAKADRVTLWDMPAITALCDDVPTARTTFPQCAFGLPFQKYTTLLGSANMASAFDAHLPSTACTCRTHAEVAVGQRAARAAAYPRAMCQAIADAIEACMP